MQQNSFTIGPIGRNNVTIIEGNNAKNTLIFAHGFGSDQTAWHEVVNAFKDEYKIVLYDNVGGGKSLIEAYSPNKYDSLHPYADDLIEIVNALNLHGAIMVGHSVSGMISLLAATKAPNMFSKMIMVGANARYLDDVDYIGGFEQAGLDKLYETMANNYFSWISGFAPAVMRNLEKPELVAHFANTLASIRPDIALSVAKVIFQSDHRADLPALNKEVLLLQAKNDMAVPLPAAEYLNKHIKNSKLALVDAEGHFPHMSAPGVIISAIKQFIEH